MPQIEWTKSLELGLDRMDHTHREFVELLNRLANAPDQDIDAAFEALFAHTLAHFEQEQQWMAAINYPPAHCHEAEHEGVLGAMREVRDYIAQGKLEVGRVLAREMAVWFESHAATMDAMLAQFLLAKQVADVPVAV